jgi:nucleotide-binding universal stress UspA family protein
MSPRLEHESVVAAVDGSEHAERALRWAAEQAHLENRRLVVVTADLDDGFTADSAAVVAQDLYPMLDVTALALPGDPRQVLVEMSRDAHLLVLGSRGRGPLTSMLLGSVSAAVSNHAACPVVVCRPAPRQQLTGGVVVGADGTPESRPVLDFAFRQASLRDLDLTVLHSFWDAVAAAAGFRNASAKVLNPSDLEDLRMVLAESVAGYTETYPDVPVTLTLRHGLVDAALTARSEAWDLIVVGRHPMDSVSRAVTGSIATAVVERARTTVAVVPEPSSD